MTDTTRALLIRIKGLLMLAVDLIDRECGLGKYGKPVIIQTAPSDDYASPLLIEEGDD